MEESFARLMQRPDIEQVVATYDEMSAKIRERLTAELGRSWQQSSDGSASGCGDDFGVGGDGETRHLPRWRSEGSLPDDQWHRVEAIVGEVAAGYGFPSRPEVLADRQGDHAVVYRTSDGALIDFGAAANMAYTIKTGCHLTAEAHRRGTPKP